MTVCKLLKSLHLLSDWLSLGREFVLVSHELLVLAFFQSLDASHRILSAIDKEVG